MNFIIQLLITAVVAYFLPYVLKGIQFDSFSTAIIFALVLAVLNVIVKPILSILGLPLTIITLGFFALVINAVIILLAAKFVTGMHVESFWWAFFFSIALSVLTSLLNGIFTSGD